MPTAHLTDRTIKALATDKRQEDVWDESLEGFGVRVSESGRKVFVVRYRANGTRRRMTIGKYPSVGLAQARAIAKGVIGAVATGGDPVAEAEAEEREGFTFRELAAEYMERHAKPKKSTRSVAEDQRQLDKDVLPAWGDVPVSEITKRDVIDLLNRIVDRGAPVMANRTRALVHRVFNFGLEEDLTDHNPALKVKPRTDERPRDRFLTEKEIKLLWAALPGHVSTEVGGLLKLVLLTAQRLGEVRRLHESQLEGSVWTIPREHHKAGRGHVVPLSEQALVVIQGLRPGKDGWLIPGPSGGHLYSYRADTDALRDHLKFKPHWTPHDLRRTATTHMARLGVSRFVRARILGHADTSVTAVYDRHAYLDEKRDALAAWGARVAKIVR